MQVDQERSERLVAAVSARLLELEVQRNDLRNKLDYRTYEWSLAAEAKTA